MTHGVTAITPTHPEYELLKEAIPRISSGMAARLYVRGMHADARLIQAKIEEHFQGLGGDFLLVTAGPCVVGLVLHTPWWSTEAVLAEEFIVRYKPGDFNDTLTALVEYARAQGAKRLCISTLAAIRQLSYIDLLTRKGFKQVSAELVKEL